MVPSGSNTYGLHVASIYCLADKAMPAVVDAAQECINEAVAEERTLTEAEIVTGSCAAKVAAMADAYDVAAGLYSDLLAAAIPQRGPAVNKT